MADELRYGDQGERVKRLQRLLNHNRYRRIVHPLKEDGVFGSLTAAAVQGTKFWAGYAKEDIKPIAGELLFGYLSDELELPPDKAERRRRRLQRIVDGRAERAALDALRLRALKLIKGELGTRESPNHSNRILYTEWWGWGPCAYCVIGVSWAWVKAGSTAFERGSRWANTDAMLADAKEGRNGLHLTDEPLPGCPGVIDFIGHSDPDHALTFVKDNGDGTCQTYEFNSTKNGVEGVWEQRRPMANCWFFEVER